MNTTTIKKAGSLYLRALALAAKPALWVALGFFAGCAFTAFTFGVIGMGQPPV